MSDFLRRSFIEDFGIPADRLVTVHCGPNIPVPELDHGMEVSLMARRRSCSWDAISSAKGALQLLEAFADVRARVPDARLVMVGGGRMAQQMEPRPGVEFVGFLSRDTEAGRRRMDSAYRGAHVFCIPTRFEPFGTSFVEAMMYGLPCVGPAAWAVPEIIDDGITGLLTPPGDHGGLVQALTRLLQDRTEARRMGDAARTRALERFAWTSLMQRMSAGLASVVAAAT
ncbi:MAG: glycosyltransferase family 4 protein [Deltaproteobacteria bacterium]|nr:glycosyltransferase family 4 protein [Deltaproteobacteria bacterium]